MAIKDMTGNEISFGDYVALPTADTIPGCILRVVGLTERIGGASIRGAYVNVDGDKGNGRVARVNVDPSACRLVMTAGGDLVA